jgi:hypothetical protein
VQDVTAVTDNAAVLQQRVTKGTNPFLSTLAEPGEAQFLTVLKPCGILLPHTHQRANEFYSVIFGTSLALCTTRGSFYNNSIGSGGRGTCRLNMHGMA